MYRPNAFREDDNDKLVAVMKANSFATFVSMAKVQTNEQITHKSRTNGSIKSSGIRLRSI